MDKFKHNTSELPYLSQEVAIDTAGTSYYFYGNAEGAPGLLIKKVVAIDTGITTTTYTHTWDTWTNRATEGTIYLPISIKLPEDSGIFQH